MSSTVAFTAGEILALQFTETLATIELTGAVDSVSDPISSHMIIMRDLMRLMPEGNMIPFDLITFNANLPAGMNSFPMTIEDYTLLLELVVDGRASMIQIDGISPTPPGHRYTIGIDASMITRHGFEEMLADTIAKVGYQPTSLYIEYPATTLYGG